MAKLRRLKTKIGRLKSKISRLNSKINFRYPLSSSLNYVAVRACYAMATNRVFGYPSKVLFEPTSSCNLKCPLCPTGRGALNRADGVMTLDQFKGLVDELRYFTTHMEMAGYGEPFLNENICSMVRYAADAGIYVNMHSNANLIDTPAKVRELVASGLSQLTLSVDGATQEVYKKYRVGGSVELVLANARAIVVEKQRQGSVFPILTMQTVVTKKNEHEVDLIRELAAQVGVDQYHAKKASLTLTRRVGSTQILKGVVDHWFPTSNQFRRHKVSDQQIYSNQCDWLYKRAFIYWNGDVTTCCYDASAINKMGNVFKAGSFRAVWNGASYRALRAQVNRDISEAKPLCSECPARVVIPISDVSDSGAKAA